jgi:hypothetical protein
MPSQFGKGRPVGSIVSCSKMDGLMKNCSFPCFRILGILSNHQTMIQLLYWTIVEVTFSSESVITDRIMEQL